MKLVFSSLDIGVRQLGQCFATLDFVLVLGSLCSTYCHILEESRGRSRLGDCKHKIEIYFQLWALTIIFDTTQLSFLTKFDTESQKEFLVLALCVPFSSQQGVCSAF